MQPRRSQRRKHLEAISGYSFLLFVGFGCDAFLFFASGERNQQPTVMFLGAVAILAGAVACRAGWLLEKLDIKS